jgi:hypothetical protein
MKNEEKTGTIRFVKKQLILFITAFSGHTPGFLVPCLRRDDKSVIGLK